MTTEEMEAVKRVIGEPVLEEFTDDLRRTKRNLLVVASIVIFYSFFDLKITEAGFLGIKFQIVPASAIDIGLGLILGYMLLQFVWKVWDHVQHIRIRVTGTRLVHQTGSSFGSQHADYPSDPRQSSLYRWWTSQSHLLEKIHELMGELNSAATALQDTAANPDIVNSPNMQSMIEAAGRGGGAANLLSARLDDLAKAITSERIPVSLGRFDRWFWNFQWSQIWRILLLEIAFPALWGGYGAYLVTAPFISTQIWNLYLMVIQ